MNSVKPLVSIICCAFNHGQYIRQCLEGFLIQKTDFAFEVLVHDDASSDDTAAIISDYEAKYPHIFKPVYQKQNQFSLGIKIWPGYQFPRVMGRYVAICEGDDYWTDQYKLKEQVDFLEKNGNFTACFTNAEILNETDNSRRIYLNGLAEGKIPSETAILRGGALYPTASVVFRYSPRIPELFKMIPELNGDNLLIMILAMQGDIYYFNRITCTYRVWEGGVYSSVMNDIRTTLGRKRNTIKGLKKLKKISERPFSGYFKQRISQESYFILQHSGVLKNLGYLFKLTVKDSLRMLIYHKMLSRNSF